MTGNPSKALRITTALALLAAGSAEAGTRSSNREGQERLIAQCIRAASDKRAWLEKTLWGLRDQEAGWVGTEIANRDGSHDLGPLQINSWWIPKLAAVTGRPASSIRWWLKHDACFNVRTARWIFLSGLGITRDYWNAVGVYHSPTKWRQRRYALAVASHLTRRFGPSVFGASALHPTKTARRAALKAGN
jgi:hypothetical protein